MAKKGLWLIVAVSIVGLFASAAMALDPMGPPVANLTKGAWSVGAEYSYSDMTIARILDSWSGASTPVDIKMQKIYANIGYGISDNVVGFVRAGFGSLEWDAITGRSYDFEGYDGDWDFIWGGGFKATLFESDTVDWGLLAQYSWSGASLSGDQEDSTTYTGTYDIKIDELQIAAGPCWKASEGVQIYGGPFLHFVRGRWSDNIWDDQIRKAIDEDSQIGGYVGGNIDVSENLCFNIEYMMTGDAYAIAAAITWLTQ